MNVREHPYLRLYTNELSTGMKCYIIPKDQYLEKQAAVAVRYGAADRRYTWDGRAGLGLVSHPAGLAHFLEHKLFEEPDFPLFDRFTQQEAAANAFTNYLCTAYYFNATGRFAENLRLLLHFVQNPHFTEENVRKEKGIIRQEIGMYRDDPGARLFTNLRQALYHQGPLRQDIAGDAAAVDAVTAERLYQAYHAFYRPARMILVCAGDLEPAAVCELAEQCVKPLPPLDIREDYGREPAAVFRDTIEERMPVSLPLFQLGFKETSFHQNALTRQAASQVLADMLSGPSSLFFARMAAAGLLDDSFAFAYDGGPFFGETVFGGASRAPERVRDLLFAEMDAVRASGLDPERFALIRRKHTGLARKAFQSLDQLVNGQIDCFAKTNGQADLFDMLSACENLTLDDVQSRLAEHFRPENAALSLVRPQ